MTLEAWFILYYTSLFLQLVNCSIQFKSQQQNHTVYPNVKHHDQERTNRTIKFIVL